MKKYKLLKDIPEVEAGAIFVQQDDSHHLIYEIPKSDDDCISLKKFMIKNFDEWFEEIKTFKIPAKFEMGFWTIIYHIDDGFYTWYMPSDEMEDIYENHIKHHMGIGLAFETEEEAEKHLEWMKARAVLLEDAKDSKNGAFNVYYNTVEGLRVGMYSDYTSPINFETKEDAYTSIKNHGEEWKIYLGVER